MSRTFPALGLAGVLLLAGVAVPVSQAAARDHDDRHAPAARPLVIAHPGAVAARAALD